MPDEMSLGEMSEFITSRTRLAPMGLVPEIRLHLADEPLHLWELTEQALGCAGLPPPFWAFAWAGGQALARYVLDHPGVVRGRRVVDIATGSGLVAIAAAMAGAASVTATDIDPFALAAVALNARANAVTVVASAVDILARDILAGDGAGQPGEGAAPADIATSDVALVGDAFYEKELAARVLRFVERAHSRGAAVLVGDLGRTYLPRSRFAELVAYDVPVLPALEGADVKRTAVWQPAW
jgi:predicted nicotinamide N-methyase